MSTQGAGSDKDEDEDDTEEEDGPLLLPGDEGFENDRPEEKCNSEDDESVVEQSASGNDCRLFSSKQVNQVCNGMAEDSESDRGVVRASRQGDEAARRNIGKRNVGSQVTARRRAQRKKKNLIDHRGGVTGLVNIIANCHVL